MLKYRKLTAIPILLLLPLIAQAQNDINTVREIKEYQDNVKKEDVYNKFKPYSFMRDFSSDYKQDSSSSKASSSYGKSIVSGKTNISDRYKIKIIKESVSLCSSSTNNVTRYYNGKLQYCKNGRWSNVDLNNNGAGGETGGGNTTPPNPAPTMCKFKIAQSGSSVYPYDYTSGNAKKLNAIYFPAPQRSKGTYSYKGYYPSSHSYFGIYNTKISSGQLYTSKSYMGSTLKYSGSVKSGYIYLMPNQAVKFTYSYSKSTSNWDKRISYSVKLECDVNSNGAPYLKQPYYTLSYSYENS